MTITTEDVETYEAKIDGFATQPEEDQCLTTATKNVLDEISGRRDVDFQFSISDLNDLCDYRPETGQDSILLQENLNSELEDYGYEMKLSRGLNEEDLRAIVKDDRRSYPIASVSPRYFDEVENSYKPRRGSSGDYQLQHVLIVFAVNSEKVLYYDTFHDIFERRQNVEVEREMSDNLFYQLWSETGNEVLWVQKEGQRTLSSPEFEG